MANPVHVAKVKEGWEAAGKWFRDEFLKPDVERWVDLSGIEISDPEIAGVFGPGTSFGWVRFDGADLRGIDVSNAVIWENEFDRANLENARFAHSEVCYSTFIGADLRGADLSGADLTGVDFMRADLSGANLRGACLYTAELFGATLDGADLSQADLSGVFLGHGSLLGVNLSTVEGLESVTHIGPSDIDASTAATIEQRLRRSSLAGCGIESIGKDLALTDIMSVPRTRNSYTLFEYHDKTLESNLTRDLLARGMPIWRGVNQSFDTSSWEDGGFSRPQPETTILICSRSSLKSEWLLDRVERILEDERTDSHGQLLFPISADDYLLKEWSHRLRDRILDREVVDFRGWQNHGSFCRSLHRLIDQLSPSGA